MAKLLPLAGISVSARVSNDREIRNKGGYELALIPTDELTSRDWNDIVQSIQELVAVDIKQYEETGPLGTQINHRQLLNDCAVCKGWRSIEGSILLALELSNNETKEALEPGFRGGLQINLFNNLPMTMPSVINGSLKHAAIERATQLTNDNEQPIITFIESTHARKRPENLTLADSGMITAQGTFLDETPPVIQPEIQVPEAEKSPEPLTLKKRKPNFQKPTPRTPANTDNEDEDDERNSSHIFVSGGRSDDFSENSDDTITALRNEVTILKNENKQANYRIRNQEQLIEDITQASEEQGIQLERELLDKTQAINSLEKEKNNDETVHMVAMDQLQLKINQLKGENSNLNELIQRVHGHERNVDRVQSKLNNRIASITSEETYQNHGRKVQTVGTNQSVIGARTSSISTEQLMVPTSFSSVPAQEELPIAPKGRLIMPKHQDNARNDDFPIAVRQSAPVTTNSNGFEMEVQQTHDLCTPSRPPIISDRSLRQSRLRSRRLTRNFLDEELPQNLSPIRQMASTRRHGFNTNQQYEDQKHLFQSEKPEYYQPTSKNDNLEKQNNYPDLRLYLNNQEVQKSFPKVDTGKKLPAARETGKEANRKEVTLATLNQLDGVNENEDYDGRKIKHRVRIFQPKDFGLTLWKPSEMDITTHLDIVAKCVEEARSLGATEANLVRLLMRTMPENYKFLSEFIGPEKRTNYEIFAAEVTRVLSERAPVQMATFLQAQRKAGEHLLSYFYRISTLYKSSNGLFGNKWQEDSHVD